jgi:hypothetical protein
MDTINRHPQSRDKRSSFNGRCAGSLAGRFFVSIFLMSTVSGQMTPGFTSVRSTPFSAIGDGVANDYYAFQQALSSLQPIFVPKGMYLINNSLGPLTVHNFSQSLTFDPNAMLICTTPNQGCLAFEGGYNPRFSGIHIAYTSVPVDDCRTPNGMCSTLYFRGTTNAVVDSTTIDSGWAMAFGFIDNISGIITRTTVNHSTRDGVYLQDNQNVQISDLRVRDSGDDCLGFHDTTAGSGRHGATATRVTCTHIRGGGLAIAGASNVTVSDFVVNGSSAPGIYVISDPTQGFLKPTNIVIYNGVIRDVGSVTDIVPRGGTQHGIMIYGSGANPLGNLKFHDIQISGTSGSGVMGGGFVDSVSLTNIDIRNSGLDGLISNASCVSITGESVVIVNSLTVQNCYRSGFLAVANSDVSVAGLTVTNAWNKGSLEPGGKAVDLFANQTIDVNGTVIIDHEAVPTGFAFSEEQNSSGAITNLTGQINNGTLQVLSQSPGVTMSIPLH